MTTVSTQNVREPKMVSEELDSLGADPRYIDAINVIDELQSPVLESLGRRIEEPLKKFLPNIRSVKLEFSTNRRRISHARTVDIIIDDGIATNIEHKGDGVKSLAALGILKDRKRIGTSILAIEEPESHLHPEAIHQINEIIQSIATDSQVIISTHNPIFVDRRHLKNNVLVSSGSAKPAKNITQIREVLGVRVSDNLSGANIVLIVEGVSDETSISAILQSHSEKLSKAIKNNVIAISPMRGSGKLTYKLQQFKQLLCETYTLLDGDEAGINAYKNAEKESLLSQADSTIILCPNHRESELEDCYDLSIYKDIVLTSFGVNLDCSEFKGNRKFSHRIEDAFRAQGKLLQPKDLENLKFVVAQAVAKNPAAALDPQKSTPIYSLISSLERMLT
jgi:putative ATP-dependent endonuclease of the OLD family